MTAKSEQKERTRESILRSASRLLRERGISGASVAEVMSGAGLTVGGFYAHFRTKEALIEASMRRTAQEMRERLFEGLEEEEPAADRAEVVLKRYLSARHRDDAINGCPLPAVVGEVGSSAREQRDVLAEEFELFAKRLSVVAPSPGHVPAKHVAIGLIALMYGGISLARAFAGTALSDEVLRACRAFGRLALLTESEP
jgi:TetR/AcrR family transcriptional repressor of nem operon